MDLEARQLLAQPGTLLQGANQHSPSVSRDAVAIETAANIGDALPSMANASHSQTSLSENSSLSESQRTSSQTRSQIASKLSQVPEDSKKIKKDFKKVGQLDITILCSICEQSVHITQLFHHKKAHQAQATLYYEHPWIETIDINKIALRRRHLISGMLKSSTYTEQAREKIGCSFELLKESLKTAPYFCIDSIADSSAQTREVSTPLIKAIGICQDKNTLWNSELQDIFIVLDNYGNRPGTCLLGLFDGSNGVSAAQTTSAELPILLLEQLSSGDHTYQVSEAERRVLDSFRTVFRADYKMRERVFTVRNTALKDKKKPSPPGKYEWIHRAYAKTFWRMDRLLRLGRNEVSRVCWSSCTAATCLVETLSNIKPQQDQEVADQLGRRINETEQVIAQPEKPQPERVMLRRREQSGIKEQVVALLLSYPKREGVKSEEELKTIQEEEPSVSEEGDKKFPPTNEDSTTGKDLPENDYSTTQSGESFGVLDVANDPEEQGFFKTLFLREQRLDSFETDDDEEELKTIEEEEPSVPEEEDTELLPNNKDISKENSLLENHHSIAQPDESSFGVMDIAKDVEEQELAPLLNDQEIESLRTDDEEDELKRIKEVYTDVSEEEEKELPLSDRDSNRKMDLPKNDDSIAQPHESSFGILDTADNIEDGEVAPSLTDQETKMQEEEELLKRISEKDMNVSEQEDTTANRKDSSKEKVLLENNQSTTQPDENSFGVMHIANIGNVHAIVCRNGKSYWVTKEHTTNCTEEKTRVLEKGGYISSNEPNGLVEGLVRPTRGLGHHGNPTLKKTIIPVPHTMSFAVDASCQFLILASNGLWEVLDKSEVVTLTLIMFSAYLKKYQQVQQEKKCRTPKYSKSSMDEEEEEDDIISWYFNPEVFTDTENNQNQNNANLGPPENNSPDEGNKKQTGPISENSEAEELEGSAEVTESVEDTTSTITEETTESGSQEGSEETEKSLEEKVPESSSSGTFSEISEDEGANPKTFYNHAAKYISKHLVKAALKAGSRDNITVLVALLNGCDKIPTYI